MIRSILKRNQEETALRLAEFEKGTEITICSKKEHSHYEYNTEIIRTQKSQGLVIAEVVIAKGREVHYLDINTEHMVTVNAGSKVYVYRDVTVVNIKTLEQSYKFAICIRSMADVQPVNRRNFFRVYLGVDGVLQAGINNRSAEVVVKDISANGLGVICTKKLQFPIGMNVLVTFVDELTSEKYEIECVIVRCVQNDSDSVIYGCQLPEINDAMQKIVALKQRLYPSV